MKERSGLRNVAIVAHVDHGKTTLVDALLKQTHVFRERAVVRECFLDSNDLERERGITILSKNISIRYRNTKINIIDTPGHSDFGGQVERVLNMADGILLLVDAAEGPMPQTRFVLGKALALGLQPIVVINKMDKPMARPHAVHEEVFDLFVALEATEKQLDFPVLYASGRAGWAANEAEGERVSIAPLLEALLEHLPAPQTRAGPLQLQMASLDYNTYVGRIGIGRVHRGLLSADEAHVLVKREGRIQPVRVKQVLVFEGLERREQAAVRCGDLCAVVGLEGVDIGDTLCAAESPAGMPPITVDEPTLSMVFRVNDSPFFGRDARFASSRHLRERLFREVERDVALRVEELSGEAFKVSGRGVLHLSILLETMRREGYECTVSKPEVIFKTVGGVRHEPLEHLSVLTPSPAAGKVIEIAGTRRGEMIRMEQRGDLRLLEFEIPTRGMIGLRTRLTTVTAGEAVITHGFLRYAPEKGDVPHRVNGVLISMGQGKTAAYALDGLQSRGRFFVDPGEETYAGMVVGEHCKENDLVVNLQRGKQLTNVRAAGSDRNLKIAPAVRLSLEEALEYIDEDELVEITPAHVRLRKRHLAENERKRRRRARRATV